MELNFVETIEGKEWVAEFEAPSDFNLHIERKGSGSLVVGQRGTASGEYDTSFVMGMYEGGMVIDYDFGALVYPKWIKVTSGSEVVSASVNFNEGGGSGSGSGSELKWEYYKIDWDSVNQDNAWMVEEVILSANYINMYNVEKRITTGTPYNMSECRYSKIACCNIPFVYKFPDSGISNIDTGSWIENWMIANELTEKPIFLIPITEDEFYILGSIDEYGYIPSLN